MANSITVSVKDGGVKTRIATAREMTMREKFLTKLFGKKAKVLVITPYSATNEITIREEGNGTASGGKKNVYFDCR